MMRWSTAAGVLLVSVLVSLHKVNACNEAICGSLVSKCMLIKCCECDMTDKNNCTCCHDCQICLSKQYFECCSCVGLCPKPEPNDNLHMTSSVEDLSEPIPELFNVLTQYEDTGKRWTTYTYPVYYDALYHKPGSLEFAMEGFDTEYRTAEHSFKVKNVTVAFMSQCMSLRKCKQTCRSMGAGRYRWFHDHGCCQCIGHKHDYGMPEPKCYMCPDEEDEEDLKTETIELEMEEKAIDG